MFLTDEEKKMLAGENGTPIRKAMEILTQLGEIYGAERMLPIQNVHMPGSSVVVTGKAGIKFVETMGCNGNKFCTYTTLNTAAVDMDNWKELGFPEEFYVDQIRLTNAYKNMGGIACHTCIPYLNGNLPRFGEHVAWGESSAIVFVNSVIGARTNREGGPSALAAALVGRVPAYGFHLDENRIGQVRVDVRSDLHGTYEYGTLGYYVGKICQELVPVFTGIPAHVTIDELKMLGAALASSGSVALYHVVGVTPEAPTLDAAFKGCTPKLELVYSRGEHQKTSAALNKIVNDKVDLVVMGCPHASIEELRCIAEQLQGKKINPDVDLWVTTALGIKELARRTGHLDLIEKAGGKVVCDTCPVLGPTADLVGKKGYRSLATNSAKLAHYIPGQWGIGSFYGSLEQCVQAALIGQWSCEL